MAAVRTDGFVPKKLQQKYRSTAAILLIWNDGLLFVQSAKDPTRQTWVLPQGGIGTEHISASILRECSEELFIPPEDLNLEGLAVLGQFINKIPPERKLHGSGKDKLIVFVALRFERRPTIRLNGKNHKFQFVFNPYALWQLMGTVSSTRPLKFTMTCNAVDEAYRRGLIGWSCQAIRQGLVA